jgi:hypothetical protein
MAGQHDQHGRPDHLAANPVAEWEQAWALADQLRAVTAGLAPDVFDDAGWELRRRLGEQTAAAEALGHRLADQAGDRAIDAVRDLSRPAEYYQRLVDQAEAASAASRARYTQRQPGHDRTTDVRDAGWQR